MRPTGKLHLGNLFGALENWVRLQHDYECYFMVADWHALTTGYSDTSNIKNDVHEMVVDWIAAGLDPEKCVIFRQAPTQRNMRELHLLLSMITPLGWLERCPTYKEHKIHQLEGKDILLIWLSGISSASGGRHTHIQGRYGSRRRRPDTAR